MEHSEGSSSGVGTATISAPATSTGINESQSHGMPGNEFNANSHESFSSKGLSMFKDVSCNTPTPMVDINHGKGKNTPFARSENLAKEDSIFDISKPFVTDFEHASIENSQEGVKPESSDTPKESPIIDIARGKVEKPIFKNIESLKPKGVIDISRPYYEPPASPSHQSEPSRESIQAEHEIESKEATPFYEEKSNPTVEIEYEVKVGTAGFQETYDKVEEQGVSIKPQFQSELNGDRAIQTHSEHQVEPQTKTEATTDSTVETVTALEPQAEVKTQTRTETKVTTAQQLDVEVASAQAVLASELATTTKISLAEAKDAIEQVIRQDSISKQAVEPEVANKKSENITKKRKKTSIEERAKELFEKRKKEVEENNNRNIQKEDETEILYFEKDKEVNTYREMVALVAAERLSATGQEVSGQRLSAAISEQLRSGKESEIVEGIKDDESSEAVIAGISRIGTIENSWTLRRILKQITDRYTAVRLAFETDDGALKNDAERVYGTNLDGVEAKFEEDSSYGRIREMENGQVVYITQKAVIEHPVAAAEGAVDY